jgi:hypothetical protein
MKRKNCKTRFMKSPRREYMSKGPEGELCIQVRLYHNCTLDTESIEDGLCSILTQVPAHEFNKCFVKAMDRIKKLQ